MNIDTLKEKVNKLIEENLPSKEKEKSKFGEVFTPVTMIETLYKNYPKKVWNNPSYTWLDPAAGIGNFSLVLFFWLMNGLKNSIPNEDKRAKHILENMIYMVEINSNNINTCKNIFRTLSPTSKLNIHKGDFLKLNTTSLNWPNKFNCIIGNPPYNIGGTGLEGSKRTHIIFTEASLKILTEKGYLSFICPPSYRETNTPMNDLFKKANGHFIFIKIYGAQDTFKLFHIQGRVDGFIYQKDIQGSTLIDDEFNVVTKDVNINLNKHIPNFGYTIFEKLYKITQQKGHIDAFRNTEMSTVKTHMFGCNGRNKILHLIVEKGKRVIKSTKKHSMTSIPKLLINGLGVPYVYYDKKGEYGPSQSPVIVLKPSKNIVNIVKSKFFSFVVWGLRLTGNNNLPYLFSAIPDISKEMNMYDSLDKIKSGFNLTNNEIKFIDDNFHSYEYKDIDIIENCAKKTRKNVNKKNKTVKKKMLITKG